MWNGRPYPLFALDRHQSDLINKALAAIEKSDLEPHQVVDLCRECSKDPNWPSKLYLPNSDHSIFRATPTDSLKELASNSMDGAETLPSTNTGVGDELEEHPPLPDPTTLNLDGSLAAVQAGQNVLNQL